MNTRATRCCVACVRFTQCDERAGEPVEELALRIFERIDGLLGRSRFDRRVTKRRESLCQIDKLDIRAERVETDLRRKRLPSASEIAGAPLETTSDPPEAGASPPNPPAN